MCGIVGIASAAGGVDRDLVTAMRDTMCHRGPDDKGLWLSPDHRVGLGHRRLAVIDLSPNGHQPMDDGSGQLQITFNGEIYNFSELRRSLERVGRRFRTTCDTEVLLHAYQEWGLDFVHRLNGMFAFALYDRREGRVLLARDRAGEKPLFYRYDGRSLVFASELKALMRHPAVTRRIDLDAMLCYLAFGYVTGNSCILAGVHKLPPASIAVYDLRSEHLKVQRYWSLPEADRPARYDAEELTDELERLLSDSIRLRLTADVPVGILLSGGLDSSIVTALGSRSATAPLRTFTVSFPGHQRFDEAEYARVVAKHFGTDHTELVAEGATAVDLLPRLARQFDEPLADSSLVPTFLVSRLIRSEATVALGGDGGDELFGGYRHYSSLQRQDRLRRLAPKTVLGLPGALASRALPVGFRGRNFLMGVRSTAEESIACRNIFFDHRSRIRLLSPHIRPRAAEARRPEERLLALCVPGRTTLQQATAVDFQSYLPDDLLVKVDRASMLPSLEQRSPWLDHRVVEFAFGRLPDELRATVRERKVLSRRLAARILPSELDLTRKQGFSLPLRAWFRSGWQEPVEEVLRETGSDLFDRARLDELITAQYRGANVERLFGLAMFELWRREYGIQPPE